ncbi:putative mannosyl-oligosaccharide glucosidase [Porphyridium purpureum]|uniref:Mannosyl-oligosaccharide glucosidase n=1 Tax=Porphyridium purpureum TaxID=35688 RepID=A0A5J4YKU5_PORPP|nr:putative mannosyl-oligosaccharide glucosidase [Porphyridium purpureum]|eukprot:POR0110..scf261_15
MGMARRACAVRVIALLAVLVGARSCVLADTPPNHRRWGLWRPRLIAGVRSNVRDSAMFGIGWQGEGAVRSALRMCADDGSNGVQFGYVRHDGRAYAQQVIVDAQLQIKMNMDWILVEHKTRDHLPAFAWVLRITGEHIETEQDLRSASGASYVSLFLTAASGADEDDIEGQEEEPHVLSEIECTGHSSDVCIQGQSGRSVSALTPYKLMYKQPTYGTPPTLSFAARPPKLAYPEHIVSTWDASISALLVAKDASKHSKGPRRDLSQPVTVLGAWAREQQFASEQHVLRYMKDDGSGVRTLHADDPEAVDSCADARTCSVAVVQRVLERDFRVEIVFSEFAFDDELLVSLCGAALDERIERARRAFDDRFHAVFRGIAQNYKAGSTETRMATYALSNLLGGFGFFHGSSWVERENTEIATSTDAGIEPKNKLETREVAQVLGQDGKLAALTPQNFFTATPSRVVFPRGFLWDEGFHQLVVLQWDTQLALESLMSWLGVIRSSGWIPREQVLGFEARAAFPKHISHLMIQNPSVANPPTMLMPWQVLARRCHNMHQGTKENSLDRVHPEQDATCSAATWEHVANALGLHLRWLDTNQRTRDASAYQWKGRNERHRPQNGRNPFTWASGLDDYPRARVPSAQEKHLDLHTWMVWAHSAMVTITSLAGHSESSVDALKRRADELKSMMETQFGGGSDRHGLLFDLDRDGAQIEHVGYVSLFPLMLGVLPHDSPRVGAALAAMQDPEQLWSVAGIRSLSKSDDYYLKGDQYWTGPVWIPINYLLLGALHNKYAAYPGPYRERARALYDDLRRTIVTNMARNFEQQSTLFENYNDRTGDGQKGRLFTGWSSLIVLIMAEEYEGLIV